ncbi:hypothetical protein PTKIN_Ptkin19aG0015300 [Pterospermum kingtungense]
MVQEYPRPCIVEFSKLIASIVRMKHFAVVVSLCNQINLLGLLHRIYTLYILINCFCHLNKVDFGLSVLGQNFQTKS